MRKINQYTCSTCGETITTVEEIEGTTPMILDCLATNGCTGKMRSHWYEVDQSLKPTFEWYKPHWKSLKNRQRQWREYVKAGGLMIRRIEK